MKVEQIYDKGLAHASYAIYSEGEVALVDPGRDPQPYIDFARKYNGKIVAVFETHPHADFASSHREFLEKFNATIYVNPDMGVEYKHSPLHDGEEVNIGKVRIRAKFTPGHSPDHNTYILIDENGNDYAVFTGDSLFIGDVGRPDLREGAGNINMKKEELAGMMFDTVRNFFQKLNDEVLVYPAHGAGSFCGKNMSKETVSTIGKERERNWAMQTEDKSTFVNVLLEDQPIVPKYFPFDVELNRRGAETFEEGVKNVRRLEKLNGIAAEALIIDSRSKEDFKKGHIKGAINIPNETKFETWVGTLIAPEEKFYLIAKDKESLEQVIRKTAKIGYEKFIEGVVVADHYEETSEFADPEEIREHPEKFTILDVRNDNEMKDNIIFSGAIHIPLHQLRENLHKIPTDKPIAVHCEAGFRSAIASSILERNLSGKTRVVDISDAIKQFKKQKHEH